MNSLRSETTDEGPSEGVDTKVGTPHDSEEERGPHQYAYFVDGPVIMRQQLVFEEWDALGPGHRESIHTGGWLVEWYEAAEEAGVDLKNHRALRLFASTASATARYILPLVLKNPEEYEREWEHVDPLHCPGCRSCQDALVDELVEAQA